MKRWTATALAIGTATVVCVELSLLFTGQRLLIDERRVQPGASYIVPDYGDVGKSAQATLVCRYFTGRRITNNVLWYSSNNMTGRDECPFLTTQTASPQTAAASEGGSAADWFSGWASFAAVLVALAGYWLVQMQRKRDDTQRRQDAAYQIGFKIASLASEARLNQKSLFPVGTSPDDWEGVTDPFAIVGAQQPAIGIMETITRDLTEAEQNLLMLLREESFLMDYSEIYARNLSILAGMQEYKERHTAVMVKLPVPQAASGQEATMALTKQQMLELHPYVTPAATLMQSLRSLAAINVEMVTKLGDTFQPMMKRHFPRLHIHKIELEDDA